MIKQIECLSKTCIFCLLMTWTVYSSPARAEKTLSLTLTSDPPSVTTEGSLEIRGIAKAQHGIEQIKCFGDHVERTTTYTLSLFGSLEEHFRFTRDLDMGENTFTLELIDTQGQTVREVFTVIRKESDVLPAPDTPLPAPPTPEQNAPPSITLTSGTPQETEHDTITIQGFATDDEGVEVISVKIKRAGLTLTYPLLSSLLQSKRVEFYETYALAVGENEISIEASDAAGQIGKKTLTVVRKISPTIASQPETEPSATPIPQPEVPALLAPGSQSDTPPAIKLITALPAETNQAVLTVQGIAIDDHGIRDVKVSVRKPDTKGLMITSVSMEREQFSTDVQLGIGANEIIVEALDTTGQTTRQTFTVVRKSLPASDVAVARLSETDPTTIQRPGEVYAVIIGVGDYQDDRIPDLRFTVNDAQGFYDLLTNPNYGGVPQDHIKLLLNRDATDRAIKGAIGRWLSQQAEPDDTVIIYYSGHGAPEEQETYWVTSNANIDNLYTTALSNNDIADMLHRIQAKRVITLLDSCYSAATVNRKNRTRNIQTEIPWDKFSGEGRVTISASDGKQLSLELEEYQHGVFTYYLLEGLQGKADNNRDGIIEVDEIWDYVKYQVTETARKAGNPQTPVFQGAVTAGIPLTINLALLQKKQQSQNIEEKQTKLNDLFRQRLIPAHQYNCAYKMLKSGGSDPILDGLLSGAIEPDVFRETFQCQ